MRTTTGAPYIGLPLPFTQSKSALTLATYRACRRYVAIIVECRHLRPRSLINISAGKK